MPTPLLHPQLDNPSQISLLGMTLFNLLKKNITEPFQLTLLNVGVTNFVGNTGPSAGGPFSRCFPLILLHTHTSLVSLCPPLFCPAPVLISSIFFSDFLSQVSLADVVLFRIANQRCLPTPALSLFLRFTVPPHHTNPVYLSFSIA